MSDDCERPKKSGKHKCEFHYLKAQPIEVQIEAARARLESRKSPHLVARIPEAGWPAGERWCSGCQSFVPLWYCGAKASRCKACASLSAHSARVEKIYGIPAKDYERLMVLQNGRCAICKAVPRKNRLAVDHSHDETLDVRGLLCKRCNHDLLGGAHDSIALLQAAIDYLRNPPYSQLSQEGGQRDTDRIDRVDSPDWVNDPEWKF